MFVSDGPLSSSDLIRLASLHAENLNTSILSALGKKVLEHYYRYIVTSDLEALFVLRSKQGLIIGACVLSFQPESLTKRVIKDNPYLVALHLGLKLITSASARKSIIYFAAGKSTLPEQLAKLPEIIQIYTDPSFRNMKIGSKLLERTEAFLLMRNQVMYFMKTVNSEDNQALHFYHHRGFQEILSTSGMKRYVYFFKKISRPPDNHLFSSSASLQVAESGTT